MTKLQVWVIVTIATAATAAVGLAVYPPVGLVGILLTIFSALWAGALYEEETRL